MIRLLCVFVLFGLLNGSVLADALFDVKPPARLPANAQVTKVGTTEMAVFPRGTTLYTGTIDNRRRLTGIRKLAQGRVFQVAGDRVLINPTRQGIVYSLKTRKKLRQPSGWVTRRIDEYGGSILERVISGATGVTCPGKARPFLLSARPDKEFLDVSCDGTGQAVGRDNIDGSLIVVTGLKNTQPTTVNFNVGLNENPDAQIVGSGDLDSVFSVVYRNGAGILRMLHGSDGSVQDLPSLFERSFLPSEDLRKVGDLTKVIIGGLQPDILYLVDSLNQLLFLANEKYLNLVVWRSYLVRRNSFLHFSGDPLRNPIAVRNWNRLRSQNFNVRIEARAERKTLAYPAKHGVGRNVSREGMPDELARAFTLYFRRCFGGAVGRRQFSDRALVARLNSCFRTSVTAVDSPLVTTDIAKKYFTVDLVAVYPVSSRSYYYSWPEIRQLNLSTRQLSLAKGVVACMLRKHNTRQVPDVGFYEEARSCARTDLALAATMAASLFQRSFGYPSNYENVEN